MDATAKSTEFRQIGEFTPAQFMRAEGSGTARDKVVEPDVMVKGIRPKRGSESSTSEHSTKCIANRLVGTLARTVLMR